MRVFVCSRCGKTAPPLGTGCHCRAETVAPEVWMQRIRTKLADAADKAARLDAWQRQHHT